MEQPQNVSDVFRNLGIDGESEPNAHRFDTSGEPIPASSHPKTEDGCGSTPLPGAQSSNPPGISEVPAEKQSLAAPQDEAVATESGGDESFKALQTGMERIERDVQSIAEASGKTVGEIREVHKLYHNEFANRLKSMQEELERYRETEKGRVFDGILGEIARLYSDNESVIDEIADDKIKKRIRYMFMDLLQILTANGVNKLRSFPGDKRNTRHCQIVERLPTTDPALHDTVAMSRSTGFYVENRSLVKEMVDIYLLSDASAVSTADN